MSIRYLTKYSFWKKNLDNEKDFTNMLEDLYSSLLDMGSKFENISPEELIKIIDQKELDAFDIKQLKSVNLDLSEAQTYLNKYRDKSEGGCSSCSHTARYHDGPSDVLLYCGLREVREGINYMKGSSPLVFKYFNSGCKDRVPLLRPLDDLIRDIKFKK